MKDKAKESKERLEHIRNAISDIERFASDNSSAEFLENDLIQNAVLLEFIIMGEAIAHVDIHILEKYNYPWYKVRSFRNIIAHEYFNIKIIAVWEIIRRDLPELKKMINNILENEFK